MIAALVFAAFLQLNGVPDPCVQAGFGDTQTDTVTGTVALTFCWPDLGVPPAAVTFLILVDNAIVFQGHLTPTLKTASGPWYFEWLPAPPMVTVAAHTFVVKVSDGTTIKQTAVRPFVRQDSAPLAEPFQPRAKAAP